MASIQNSCQNSALVSWCFFWGGPLGGGGGVARWPYVSCVVFDVLLCILTNCFFRVCLLGFSSLLSAVFSAPFRVLPASLIASLASCRFLSVCFFGLLFTAELRFSDRFFGPCSHIVGMCSCKARRFVEALRSLGFSILHFSVCFRFFWSGLLCTAQLVFLQLRTCSSSKNLFFLQFHDK